MSLRAFHLFFIGLSVVLTVCFAVWAAGQYQAAQGAQYVVTGAVSLAAGLGLTAYGVAFQRKTKGLG